MEARGSPGRHSDDDPLLTRFVYPAQVTMNRVASMWRLPP